MELFVANVNFDTTEAQLQNLFESHGQVAKVKLITDRDTGNPRGFGFVTMPNPTEAHRAIAELHDQDFMGRKITVREAQPKRENPGFNGGGRQGQSRGNQRGGFDGNRRQRGAAESEALTSVLAIAIIAILLLGGRMISNWRCHSQAHDMGMKCEWGLIKGCMVETAKGAWIPMDKYRYIGD